MPFGNGSLICPRTRSWSAVLLALHADHTPVTKVERRTDTHREGFARLAVQQALTLFAAGRYDRAAIMRAAIVARARCEVTGATWGVCLSAALKGTRTVAKAARLRVAH